MLSSLEREPKHLDVLVKHTLVGVIYVARHANLTCEDVEHGLLIATKRKCEGFSRKRTKETDHVAV